MAHIRQQLRNKVKTIVEGAGITAFVNRVHQISQSDLPCAVITTDSDRVEKFSINSAKKMRSITLVVMLYAQSRENVDKAIDDLCVAVENAIEADTTVAANRFDLVTTSIEVFGEGEQPVAQATMNYKVDFFDVSDPEQII